MKKKILMLLPLLGLLGLSSCNSSFIELDDPVDGRTVDENWREHSCSIVVNVRDTNRYSTCEPGDYIWDIDFVTEMPFADGYCITYNTNFYIWDDMEAQFVFANGYVTPIERTNHPLGRESLKIPREDCWKRGLKYSTIVKIRVRTVD